MTDFHPFTSGGPLRLSFLETFKIKSAHIEIVVRKKQIARRDIESVRENGDIIPVGWIKVNLRSIWIRIRCH